MSSIDLTLSSDAEQGPLLAATPRSNHPTGRSVNYQLSKQSSNNAGPQGTRFPGTSQLGEAPSDGGSNISASKTSATRANISSSSSPLEGQPNAKRANFGQATQTTQLELGDSDEDDDETRHTKLKAAAARRRLSRIARKSTLSKPPNPRVKATNQIVLSSDSSSDSSPARRSGIDLFSVLDSGSDRPPCRTPETNPSQYVQPMASPRKSFTETNPAHSPIQATCGTGSAPQREIPNQQKSGTLLTSPLKPNRLVKRTSSPTKAVPDSQAQARKSPTNRNTRSLVSTERGRHATPNAGTWPSALTAQHQPIASTSAATRILDTKAAAMTGQDSNAAWKKAYSAGIQPGRPDPKGKGKEKAVDQDVGHSTDILYDSNDSHACTWQRGRVGASNQPARHRKTRSPQPHQQAISTQLVSGNAYAPSSASSTYSAGTSTSRHSISAIKPKPPASYQPQTPLSSISTRFGSPADLSPNRAPPVSRTASSIETTSPGDPSVDLDRATPVSTSKDEPSRRHGKIKDPPFIPCSPRQHSLVPKCSRSSLPSTTMSSAPRETTPASTSASKSHALEVPLHEPAPPAPLPNRSAKSEVLVLSSSSERGGDSEPDSDIEIIASKPVSALPISSRVPSSSSSWLSSSVRPFLLDVSSAGQVERDAAIRRLEQLEERKQFLSRRKKFLEDELRLERQKRESKERQERVEGDILEKEAAERITGNHERTTVERAKERTKVATEILGAGEGEKDGHERHQPELEEVNFEARVETLLEPDRLLREERDRRDQEELVHFCDTVLPPLQAQTASFRASLASNVRDKWDEILNEVIATQGVSTGKEYMERIEEAKATLERSFPTKSWIEKRGVASTNATSDIFLRESGDQTELREVSHKDHRPEHNEFSTRTPEGTTSLSTSSIDIGGSDPEIEVWGISRTRGSSQESNHIVEEDANSDKEGEEEQESEEDVERAQSDEKLFEEDEEVHPRAQIRTYTPRHESPVGQDSYENGDMEDEPSDASVPPRRFAETDSELEEEEVRQLVGISRPKQPVTKEAHFQSDMQLNASINPYVHDCAKSTTPPPDPPRNRDRKKPKTFSTHARKSAGTVGKPVHLHLRAIKSTNARHITQLAPTVTSSPPSDSPSPTPPSGSQENVPVENQATKKREVTEDTKEYQRRRKRLRAILSDDLGKSPETSGTSTPTSGEEHSRTTLEVGVRDQDDHHRTIEAPLKLGDRLEAVSKNVHLGETDEDYFKRQQKRLPSYCRQIAGPSYDLHDEFPQTIQQSVAVREGQWKKLHPERGPPIRDGYKMLYEEMIRDANSKEFAPGERPLIRIIPLEHSEPTDYSSPEFELCYTNRVIYAEGIVPDQAPGCGCRGNCADPENRASCACRKRQIAASTTRVGGSERSGRQDFAYDGNGILNAKVLAAGDPIIECNSACGCGEECINRVVGKKMPISVDIYRTEDKGWGIRNPTSYHDPLIGTHVQRTIRRGEPLGIYAGELITAEEGGLRDDLVYRKIGRCYTYSLDAWTVGEDYRALAPKVEAAKMVVTSTDASHLTIPRGAARKSSKLSDLGRQTRLKIRSRNSILTEQVPDEDEGFTAIYNVDAFSYGNWTRFANHNCQDFNVSVRTVYVDEANVTRPLWVYVAHKDIRPGEEISISYYSETEPKLSDAGGISLREWQLRARNLRREQPKNFRCYCHKPLCRGIMFKIDDENLFFERFASG